MYKKERKEKKGSKGDKEEGRKSPRSWKQTKLVSEREKKEPCGLILSFILS